MRETHAETAIDFAVPVSDQGYRWWYVDALSEDGRTGIVVIAFIGSVFSPYYAWSRARGQARAADHCAINVALYRPGGGRWCMTERGSNALERNVQSLRIGPSHLNWDGEALRIEIDEWCVPWPRRMQGTLILRPHAVLNTRHDLEERDHHIWHPIAPRAQVEVNLRHPAWRWSGHGYWDSNAGNAPMETAFKRWNWSRARLADGRLAVLYDIARRDGSLHRLALDFDHAGEVHHFEPPATAALPGGLWGVQRSTRCEPGTNARLIRSLEDGPFYTRSSIATQLMNQPVVAMHESLDLDRIRKQWVRMLLPFRMPRRA
jgi:carotenoid 1,2-hydratase